MRNNNIFNSLVALFIATSLTIYAQDQREAIRKKLEADYAVTQPTADNTDIVTAGAVLVIKRGKLMLAPINVQNFYQNTYKDGKVSQNAAGKLKNWSRPFGTTLPQEPGEPRTFVPGEKLWLTRIEVREDGVVFSLLSDALGDTRYRGTLKFAYTKGSFPAPDTADHIVAEVFGLQPGEEARGQLQGGQGAPAAAAPQPPSAAEAAPAPIAPPPPPVDQPAAAPKTIALGQTPSQVTAVFGAPQKDFKLGAKEIYTYTDMKVTFVNGKVSDVQ